MDMNYKYLVVNAGSSSLKFTLFSMPGEELIVKGNIEKIGEEKAIWEFFNENEKIAKGEAIVKNHSDAVNLMLSELFVNNIIKDTSEIKEIGYCTLHGEKNNNDSTLMDDECNMYSVPYSDDTDYEVRKYDFHEKSYKYITETMKKRYL